MKKILFILLVIVSFNLNAQYITNYAKNVDNKEIDGFYYHLPRNILHIDFTIEKIQQIKGKYSSYADEMLNTDNYIRENSIKYRIKNINIKTLTEADPNYVFYISADEKNKENLNIGLQLTSDGIIQSFGYNTNDIVNTQNQLFIEDIDTEDQISDYSYIPIREDEEDEEDSISGNKLSEKEIAETIVNEIKNLRVAYFDLITGYQEVNYGNTINHMIDEIKELEQEYLSMFIGKTVTNTYNQTFYIIPEEGKNSVSIGKFSEDEGFNMKNGNNIKINFTDSSIGNNVNKLSKDEIENMTYNNKLFYRNPANVNVQILDGERIIFDNRIVISQLGNIILIPMNKMKFIFDTNTGQVISITKD